MTHIVTRSFIAGGRTLEVGAAVDGSSWPNVKLLVDQGYLMPAPPAPAPPPAPPAPVPPPAPTPATPIPDHTTARRR